MILVAFAPRNSHANFYIDLTIAYIINLAKVILQDYVSRSVVLSQNATFLSVIIFLKRFSCSLEFLFLRVLQCSYISMIHYDSHHQIRQMEVKVNGQGHFMVISRARRKP